MNLVQLACGAFFLPQLKVDVTFDMVKPVHDVGTMDVVLTFF